MATDVTINLDLSTLKKYWLSGSAALVGIWAQLNPDAQAQLIHIVSSAIHNYPGLAKLFGVIAVIAIDFKQSPIAPPAPKPVDPILTSK